MLFKFIYTKIKGLFRSKEQTDPRISDKTLAQRMDRIERNYIILLKRVLELDGVALVGKTHNFTAKIMQTPNDLNDKGINEPEPTIH